MGKRCDVRSERNKICAFPQGGIDCRSEFESCSWIEPDGLPSVSSPPCAKMLYSRWLPVTKSNLYPDSRMTTPYTACCGQLAKTPKKWLITGVAGYLPHIVGHSVQPARVAHIDGLLG